MEVVSPVQSPPFTTKNSRIIPVYPSLDTQQIPRNSQLGIDTFSPVDKNGCFAFDRVLKAGEVLKRTRKTKSWKSVHIVLRPNLLSIYKDAECTKLRHSVNLSELTAIARQKDPKSKAQHVFGIFSPSRNFHLSTRTEKDAQEWVELIRQEARIDEEEEDMVFMSPTTSVKHKFLGFGRCHREQQDRRDGIGSSSSDQDFRTLPEVQQSQTALNYSGPENGSFTDFSDAPGNSTLSLAQLAQPGSKSVYSSTNGTPRPSFQRNQSQMSTSGMVQQSASESNEERVIYHGYLLLLKSISGVRQWKRVWVVLRPKCLAFYKNDDEYSPMLIIPMGNIVDAVEIDPISKSKQFCLQIITEERNYRLSAHSEMELSKVLGGFKSIMVKRKLVQ